MRLIRFVKYSVIPRGSIQCDSALENCQQVNMAFLSHSLKASGLYIESECAIQRAAKLGTPSSSAFLSFSPRSPMVHVTQGFIAHGEVAGKNSTEFALMLCLDLLEITTKPGRASASSVAHIALPRSHAERSPDNWHHAGDQLPEGTTGAAAQQPSLGLLPSILTPLPCCSREMGSTKGEEGWMIFHKYHMKKTPYQLLERNSCSCSVWKMPSTERFYLLPLQYKL